MRFLLALIGIAAIAISGLFLFSRRQPAQPPTPAAVVAASPVLIEPVEDPGPLPEEPDYIFIDRANMRVSLYQDHKLAGMHDVASIRDTGSKFDTPTGRFKIRTKEDKHFSSIGHVWMPYAMQFEGNFFIHGWPYYPNGTPVTPGYSGGCVRLEDDVAQAVYDFAHIGMPVLIK